MLVYLHFDQSRKVWPYCGALLLFALGLLSKTVIATLPGGLLVIFWWQRGRLSWKNDVLPLVPFLLLGAGSGMITACWELQINKCVGPDFTLTLVERCLIAGRTAWFLLWKLLWPTQLTFIYPRWPINAGVWWQYLFPLGGVGLLLALWSIRRRARGPLAAALFFGGTLFPMLGFFNLYTFRYSFVANHYQYLAGLGLFALVAAGATLLLDRRKLWNRPGGYVLCLAPLAVLAGLTRQQSCMYSDVETLYATTIAENPDCWMACNNLGLVLAERGQYDRAIVLYRKVLKIKPDHAKARTNLVAALYRLGRADEAAVELQKAMHTEPEPADVRYSLGVILYEHGRIAEAIAQWEELIRLQPENVPALNQLAWVRATSRTASVRDGAAAVELARRAVKLTDHGQPAIVDTLAAAYAEAGRFAEAVETARQALELAAGQHNAALADKLRARFELYQAGTPYREPQQPSTNSHTDHP